MGYETDHPPIIYLERRIKYYKKIRGTVRGWPKNEYLLNKYGKSKMIKLSKSAESRYDRRIKEYERAIEILKAME